MALPALHQDRQAAMLAFASNRQTYPLLSILKISYSHGKRSDRFDVCSLLQSPPNVQFHQSRTVNEREETSLPLSGREDQIKGSKDPDPIERI